MDGVRHPKIKNCSFKRGSYWYSKMTDGVRPWVNLQTADPAEALRRSLEIQSNPLVFNPDSLESKTKAFTAHKLSKNEYSRNSSKTKPPAITAFFDWLGNPKIESVTATDVERYYTHLRKSLQDSTIQGYIMTLRSFFEWAKEKRYRIDNPVAKVEFGKVDVVARKNWLPRDCKNFIIEQAPTDSLKFICFCGFDAGLRRDEICESRRDWFDLDKKLIHVRKAIQPPRLREGELPFKLKTRHERTIDMTKPFHKFLNSLFSRVNLDPLDFVLEPTVKHGEARYRWDFRRPFNEFIATLKWKGKPIHCTPHDMRRSFASILASSGQVTIHQIAAYIGDSIRTTERHYAHLMPGNKGIHALTSG